MRKAATTTRRSRNNLLRRLRARRFRLERLEPRELLTIYTVTNTSDNTSQGSLRWAITKVNNDSSADTINFNIAATGVQTINLGSPLPAITNSVLINGSTQNSGASTPPVVINGSALSSSDAVLYDSGGSCTIKDLAIVGCPGIGIELYGGASDLIEGCYVGTADGTHATANGTGIELFGSANVTIGGTVAGSKNVISGNTQNGIEMSPGSNNDNALGTLIQGNVIGLVAAGTSSLANSDNGIFQNGADNTTIGGTTALARNIISGNAQDGISLGTGIDSLVEGNYLGTDVTGKLALANNEGLDFTNASYATIGGTVKGAGNLLSGNIDSGINCFVLGSTGELIQGNLIGVDVSGTLALPNSDTGLRIAGPTNCTIGGTIAAAANVISANTHDGLALTVGPSNGLVALGNLIGTDSEGYKLGNGGNGVTVWSDDVTIGGTAAGDGNVIAYNADAGIQLVFNVDHDSFLSNSIHDNGNLGINFGNGPTANHPNETGFNLPAPNDYQNYPLLTSATSSTNSSEIIGTLNAANTRTYLIQFFANLKADPSGYGQGELYLGSETVNTGLDYDANIDAHLTTAIPAGWVVSATATDPLGNTSEFSPDIVPVPSADVGVSISALPSPVAYVGSALTYTVLVTQNGPESAQNVTVTDNLPANIGSNITASTSVPGVTPTIFVGNVVTATFPAMAANTSAMLTITVFPTAAAVSQISDTATVTSQGTVDPNSNNNTATLVTTVDPSADLALTLTGGPRPVTVGAAETYTLTATNSGPFAAPDVTVTDELPLNITSNVMATTTVPGVTPTIAGGQLTADLGTLASGAMATITISVVPDSAAVPQMIDSASISSSMYDPDTTNNSPAPVITTVNPPPMSDLSIMMSGAPNHVDAGSNLTYTIIATNGGPSVDPDAVVTDTLPANVTFVSATGGATPSGGVLTLPLGSLAVHGTSTITIIVTPTAAAAGSGSATITNNAVINGEFNGNLQNSASTTTTVLAATAFSIQVTPSLTTAQAGQDLTYTVAATNNGPSDATGVVVSDALPADITSDVTAMTSVPGVTATVAGSLVTANFGDIAAGDSVTVTITVVPTLAAVTDSPLVDQATVTDNQANPNPNTVMSSVPVGPVSDLAIMMTGSVASIGAGSKLTYTIHASNSGPSTDSAAVVTDTLPANVTFVSATGGVTPSAGVLTLPLGSLAPGAMTTLTIVVMPTAAAAGTGAGGGSIMNNAVINSPENTNLDNSASVTTTVTAVTAIGLQLTATTGPNYVGQNLKYTITATNSGPSGATGVVLTDTLPPDITANVTATTSVPGVTASIAGGKVTASFGDLALNTPVVLSITVVPTTSAVSASPLVDSVHVTNNEFDASPSTAMVSNTIVPVADLAITQFTAAPDPVVYGSALTYTAVVTNNGPSPATGVTFTLPLPADIAFGSGTWAMAASPAVSGLVNQEGSNLVGTMGDLAVGSSVKIKIVVTPQQSAVGPLSVTGTAAGGQFNALPAAATETVMTTVNDQPGNLQFTASAYAVPETAGSAAITLVRTNGLSGQVSVNFTTVPMGATAGLDYKPVTQTVVFPAGMARETINVPVLADPYDDHNETVGLAISDPTGGAGLGSVTTATLTIDDTDPNSTIPMVAAVQWTGTSRSITSLIISFNEPLDPATAVNPANYAVAGVGKKGSFSTQHGQNVSFATPMYDQSNWAVTLVPTHSLGVNQFYSLFLKGTQGGITNGGGIELAGAGAGRTGTNFTALFAQGTNLKYTDAGGNQVTFGVKGGGYLQDLLTGSGLGQRLVLVGGVPHRTTVTGSVKQGKHGSGRAYLGYSFYGLGSFGSVKVTLKSPPFQIQRFPFSPGLPLGPPTPLARVSNAPVEAIKLGNATPAAVRIGVVYPKRRWIGGRLSSTEGGS